MLKLIFLFSISLISIVKSQQCRQLVRRPEIRELNKSQLDRFIRALTTLRNYRDQDLYAQSSAIHVNNAEYAHGVPAFLPWHRVYLRNLELNLQKIDSSVVLPYWDWSIDAQDPERSVVFKIFGGNGKGRDKCVTDGPFANSIMRVPNRHCLRRDFDDGNKISSLISTEALELILSRSKTFDQFRKQIEGNPHGAVHMNIGGDRGDFNTMYSPNDPIFYLHHVFIDLLWFEWQERNPRLANTYNGRANSRNVN
ncbi:Di-copper centre-containing protein, partial [Neoconidiobolus thromboides FSU 785]